MQPIVTLTMNPSLDIASETERLIPAEKLRCTAPQYHAGGGGINVARALRVLGGDPVAIFPAGGPSGSVIAGLLGEERVRCDVVPIAGLTRECVDIYEQTGGRQYRFVMPGPTMSRAEQMRCLDRIAAQRPAPRFLVASGSLPPGVPDDFYRRVIRLAHELGARVILDTSGPALRLAGHGAFLIKPSLQELCELSGRDIRTEAEQEHAARGLIGEGRCEVVVLSLGGDGALLTTAEGHHRLPPVRVKVRSTVGAGDSMVAGMVLGLAQGWDVADAALLGVAAATAALIRPGTQLCRREDVDRYFRLLGEGKKAAAAAPHAQEEERVYG